MSDNTVIPQKTSGREYWLNKFDTNMAELDLQLDFVNTSEYNSCEYKIVFDTEVASKLINFCGKDDVLIYIVLLSALKIVLFKYINQNDISVGVHSYSEYVTTTLNNFLIFRDIISENMTVNELLNSVKATVLESIKHQNYPLQEIFSELNIDEIILSLLKVIFIYENINKKLIIEKMKESNISHLIICFKRVDISVEGKVFYNSCVFKEETIETMIKHFQNVLRQIFINKDLILKDLQLMDIHEQQKVLFEFNNTVQDYSKERTIDQLFEEQVRENPDKIAVIFERYQLTYGELNVKANQLACFLSREYDISPGDTVGVLLERTHDMIVAVLGILKAGGTYVPIDPMYPEERIKIIINNSAVKVVVSSKKNIKNLNKIQWECPNFSAYICMDSVDIYSEIEEINELMDEKLWGYIGNSATNEIKGGGWVSSYTGEDFSIEEMNEYAENIFIKLKPYLKNDTRILEIGCASGISMFKIAPHVKYYYGIDLSKAIIDKNINKIKENNIPNIGLQVMAAHEIDKLSHEKFDIIILNSVIHYFHGLNYLRKVIQNSFRLLNDQGIIFLGDVMDTELKEELVQSLVDFQKQNYGKNYKTKIDFSAELFVSKDFFNDLQVDFKEIKSVDFSNKIYTIENELTKFRYDVVLSIDKISNIQKPCSTKKKYQHDLSSLMKYENDCIEKKNTPNDIAYIIFTSGSTGIPKGVTIQHKAVINVIDWVNKTFHISPADEILFVTSLCFDLSVYDIFGILAAGGKIRIASQEEIHDPKRLLHILCNEPITFWDSAPALLQQLVPYLESADNQSNQLRLIFLSGDWIPVTLPDQIRKVFPTANMISLGGATEATIWSNYYPIKEVKPNWKSIPYGKPIQNCQYYIADEHLQPCPVCVPGDLYIGGDCLANGYLNDSTLTGKKFIENPFSPDSSQLIYKTGDIARWLTDGNIEFLGRKDQQIKIRGYRIELGEIESTIKRFPFVREAIVIASEEKFEEKSLTAYIILDKSNASSCSTKPRYKLPNNMVIFQKNKNETDFMYKEIFQDQIYFKYGIDLEDGDCIFDVGANIGLFTLYVCQKIENGKIFAFEPIPELFKFLNDNMKLYGKNTNVFNYGLSDQIKTDPMIYYPKSSIMSSCYGDREKDQEVFLKSMLVHCESEGLDLSKYRQEFIGDRFDGVELFCEFKTISDVIKENGISQIDLIKINVERSEMDVLNGIKTEDWEKIKQLVIEVHNSDELKQIVSLLQRFDYDIEIDEVKFLGVFRVYARKKNYFKQSGKINKNVTNSITDQEDSSFCIDVLRDFLRKNLPDYMIPTYYVVLDEIPLTNNGKIDRKKLLKMNNNINFGEGYEAPWNSVEEELVNIWSQVLKLDKEMIGVNDNFFDLGGNSVKIVQIHVYLEKLYPEITVTDLFTYPTIRKLSSYIDKARKDANFEGFTIESIDLPPEYFGNFDEDKTGYTFAFQINEVNYEKLKTLANREEISLTEYLLTVYGYLLMQITQKEELAVQVMLNNDNQVYSIHLSLDGVTSFNEFSKEVNQSINNISEKHGYNIRDVVNLIVDKNQNAIIPLFYVENDLVLDLRLPSFYDIILGVQIGKYSVNLKIEYNNHRLNNHKVKEVVNLYIRLLESLLDSSLTNL